MRQKTVLVGGPIQYAIKENGIFDDHLKSQINSVLDILKTANHLIFSAHEIEQFGKINMDGKSNLICQRDYYWMKQCEVFVCILSVSKNGSLYRSDGTCIELGWASALGKKIIILKNMKQDYSHLVDGLNAVSNVIYLDIETCIQSPTLLLDHISSD
jgi:nucleoside 2-deoxyribosyltransferase